jgi:hypothetical protein
MEAENAVVTAEMDLRGATISPDATLLILVLVLLILIMKLIMIMMLLSMILLLKLNKVVV